MSMQSSQFCLPIYQWSDKRRHSTSTHRVPCKNNNFKPKTKMSTSFSPYTRIRLADDKIVILKDLKLGDVIKGGIIVNCILKIRNSDRVPFYRIFSHEINEYIYVTGCHFILENGNFIRVRDSSHAQLTDIVEDTFICLITSTHRIPIGEHTFWDWTDFCESCDNGCIPQEYFMCDRFNAF